MPSFESDGVGISYEVAGAGPPVLLIHGFASNSAVNWVFTGWVETLVDAGFQAVTMDNRGHGESGKLYDPAAYALEAMAEDARRLLDHLGIASAAVMGYSLGARITSWLAITHPARVSRAILAGLAGNLILGVGRGDAIAEALEAPSLADVSGAMPRAFRSFAEQTRSDLRALAACMRSSRRKISAEDFARITCPTLIVVGEKDDIAGPIEPILAAIPGSKSAILPGRNHMNAVGDRGYKDAALAFLKAP